MSRMDLREVAMTPISTALEYWDAAFEQLRDFTYLYDCGCCRCCGCSCGVSWPPDPWDYPDPPEEFLWWLYGEEEDLPHTPLLDGSTRGTTAFAMRRRNIR